MGPLIAILTHCWLCAIDAFLSGEFIQAAYFESTKDRVIRGLKTYFGSRRADSHAVYYRDALLASKDRGIDASLSLAEKSTLDGVRGHFRAVLGNPEIRLECLFSGNVSAQAARTFYQAASSKIQKAQTLNPTETRHEVPIPGKTRRDQGYNRVCRIVFSANRFPFCSWYGGTSSESRRRY